MMPRRSDPTRLAGVRRVFLADVRRRFAALRRSLRRLVADEDAFGLTSTTSLTSRWRGLPDAERLKQFRAWLDVEIGRRLFDATPSGPWWTRHVEAAYLRGINRAFDDVRRPLLRDAATVAGERAEFVRRVMTGGARLAESASQLADSASWRVIANARHPLRDFAGRFVSERVLALSERLGVELRGATDAMAQKVARAVLDALDRGDTPRQLAAAIDEAVDVGMRRALLIATTELTRAHAEGQLDGLEALGMSEAAVMAEWDAQGANPCELCAALDGVVFKLSEARGLLPRHPSCMCAWQISTLPAWRQGKGTKRAAERAVRKSVRAETKGGRRKPSNWRGADVEITRRR